MAILRHFCDTDILQVKKRRYCDMSQNELHTLIDTWNTRQYDGDYFEMFAVVDDEIIVGQASLYGRSQHIVSCGLEIYHEYQGKGYGASAYHDLLFLAKQKGYTVAVAQVRADNAASILLHKKIGFEAEEYTYINKKGDQVYYFIKAL